MKQQILPGINETKIGESLRKFSSNFTRNFSLVQISILMNLKIQLVAKTPFQGVNKNCSVGAGLDKLNIPISF